MTEREEKRCINKYIRETEKRSVTKDRTKGMKKNTIVVASAEEKKTSKRTKDVSERSEHLFLPKEQPTYLKDS